MRWKKKKNMMSMDLEEELMHLKLVLHATLLRNLVLPLVVIQMTLQVWKGSGAYHEMLQPLPEKDLFIT